MARDPARIAVERGLSGDQPPRQATQAVGSAFGRRDAARRDLGTTRAHRAHWCGGSCHVAMERGHAEIDQHRAQGLRPIHFQAYVFQTQVAVHDAVAVDVGQGAGDVAGHPDRGAPMQRAVGQAIREIVAGDPAQDHELAAVGRAPMIEQTRDVRVALHAGHAQFQQRGLADGRLAERQLDRDPAAIAQVRGQPDFGHRADAGESFEAVAVGQPFAGVGGDRAGESVRGRATMLASGAIPPGQPSWRRTVVTHSLAQTRLRAVETQATLGPDRRF